jgi:hypothetical protein
VLLQVVIERGKLTTNGPLSPKGRRRISTRNTKPSSVRASSKRMISRPSRLKYSSLSTTRAPSVSPACANKNTRSMSEEKFSSRPPSFAHAKHDQRHLGAGGVSRHAKRGEKVRLRRRRCGTDAAIREVRQRVQGFGYIGMAGDVAPCDAQQFSPSPLAQDPLGVSGRCGGRGTPFVLFVCVTNQPPKSLRILDQRGSSELASRNEAHEFVLEGLRKSVIYLQQWILVARALPPPHHTIAQDGRQRMQILERFAHDGD